MMTALIEGAERAVGAAPRARPAPLWAAWAVLGLCLPALAQTAQPEPAQSGPRIVIRTLGAKSAPDLHLQPAPDVAHIPPVGHLDAKTGLPKQLSKPLADRTTEFAHHPTQPIPVPSRDPEALALHLPHRSVDTLTQQPAALKNTQSAQAGMVDPASRLQAELVDDPTAP
jgi:hypothetical protein